MLNARNGASDECLFYIALPKVSIYDEPYPDKAFYSKPGDDAIESYTISYSNAKMEKLFEIIHHENFKINYNLSEKP